MHINERTRVFVAELSRYSGGALVRGEDLALLIELAQAHSKVKNFERLAFLAKFAAKSRKIMERIGTSGEGYDKLAAELTVSVGEICRLLAHLTDFGTEVERSHFAQTYLAKTPNALENLFSLLSDLGWYKNWTIDHRDWKLS